MVRVRPYERADGTQAKGHSRWGSGARQNMAVKFPEWDKQRPLPEPTVSYPIRFASPGAGR